MLPVLHLNGYKIANPTVLARIPAASELRSLLEGYGYAPRLRRRETSPAAMHQLMAATLDEVTDEIAADPAPGAREWRRHPPTGGRAGR